MMKWYNDPIYFEMCKKATEVQRLHKPEEADYYRCACSSCAKNGSTYVVADYDIDRINNRDLTDIEPTYAKMVKMADVCTFAAYYFERDEEYLSYIWLPRQDQLQEMVLNVYDNKDVLVNVFYNFCFSYKGAKDYYKWNNYSFELLWLAFVMFKQYHKIWNDENWIEKEKNNENS